MNNNENNKVYWVIGIIVFLVVFIKYYEVSKNTKNIVRYGFGFMTIPDSIVYRKIFYKYLVINFSGG